MFKDYNMNQVVLPADTLYYFSESLLLAVFYPSLYLQHLPFKEKQLLAYIRLFSYK